MRIVYCAKFDQPSSNDDEGAIIHALRELGHEVTPVREEMGTRWLPKLDGDLLLFHKFDSPETLAKCRERFGKIATWYFDLVWWPDPLLAARCRARMDWMARTLPLVDLAFMTDGDWAEKVNDPAAASDIQGKARWLPQGADGRIAGWHPPADVRPSILFTGISRGGGQDRVSFVEQMQARYGPGFLQVDKGLHGADLGRMIAAADIVVAPDSPVTDRYWSNRVFLTLGFGGFLLHPWCERLAKMYCADELVMYRDRDDLHRLISAYSSQEVQRREIAEAGLKRTLEQHLYLHRCQQLIEEVSK